MTDETTPTAETTVDTTAPVVASEAAPAPESPLHALADDLHALLTRVEGLEHDIKAELAEGLEALAAKLKAAL